MTNIMPPRTSHASNLDFTLAMNPLQQHFSNLFDSPLALDTLRPSTDTAIVPPLITSIHSPYTPVPEAPKKRGRRRIDPCETQKDKKKRLSAERKEYKRQAKTTVSALPASTAHSRLCYATNHPYLRQQEQRLVVHQREGMPPNNQLQTPYHLGRPHQPCPCFEALHCKCLAHRLAGSFQDDPIDNFDMDAVQKVQLARIAQELATHEDVTTCPAYTTTTTTLAVTPATFPGSILPFFIPHPSPSVPAPQPRQPLGKIPGNVQHRRSTFVAPGIYSCTPFVAPQQRQDPPLSALINFDEDDFLTASESEPPSTQDSFSSGQLFSDMSPTESCELGFEPWGYAADFGEEGCGLSDGDSVHGIRHSVLKT